ncbi:MAG: ABC transporter ATP-binding protein [Lachnospiraceae bacterium]|nr:ABC transporter ATP-binding protein [Lachnospiraceae bacterium]
MKLEVKEISATYGDKRVLEDIRLHLAEGELVSLLGASGVGKTTLFHIIAGLMTPDSGSIWLGGEEITDRPGKISYMLQKDMLLPYKTVLDNVSLPLQIKKVKKRVARQEAKQYFREFGLEGYENKYPAQLSGGMRQRAALLRTYLFSSEVALLDEPFSALDTMTKNAMHQWYLSVMERIHLSTLLITHDIDEAILLSDRIYVLAGQPGKIRDEIRIDRKKPRDSDFILTEEFLSYKKQIMALI